MPSSVEGITVIGALGAVYASEVGHLASEAGRHSFLELPCPVLPRLEIGRAPCRCGLGAGLQPWLST